MDFKVIVLFAMTAIFFGFWLLVLLKGPKQTLNRVFSIFVINMALWSFGLGMFYKSQSPEASLFWAKILYIAGSLIPAAFLHFSFIFPSGKMSISRFKQFLIYAPNTILFYLFFFTPIIVKGVTLPGQPKGFIYGPGHILWDLQFDTIFAWAFVRFYMAYKRCTGIVKMRLIYVILGTLTGVILAGLTNVIMPWFNRFELLWLAPPFTLTWLGCITYAVIKYRLMDIKIAITRTGIFAFVYLCILGLPFWVGYSLLGKGIWLVVLLFGMALASLGPFIYNYLRRKAENRLLAEDLKKYDILKRLTRTIGLIRDLDEIVLLIVYRLVKTLRVSHAMIFLFDRAENSYVLKSMRRLNGIKLGLSSNILPDTDFIKFLLLWRKDLLLEDIQKLIQEPKPNNSKQGKDYSQVNLPNVASLMQAINASLIIPHFLEKELIGFLVLGKKASNKPYSEADIEVLSTLSRSASLQIMNAMSMIELQKAEREFADAARIIEIGNYASATEHQLGNVLNTIIWACHGLKINKTIVNILQNYPDAYEAFKKCADAIITDAKDGGTIVKEIRDYSQQDASKEHKLTNLKEVIDKTLRILYIHVNKFQNIDISIDISSDVPLVLGSPVGLQQVFINMFNNGYDSIQEMKEHINSHPKSGITDYKGRIEVHIRRVKGEVEIHIIDNGKGIPEDVSRKLFAPHFTTKGSHEKRKEMHLNGGTGIGLYIMQRIIFDHGGTIALFRSEPLKGADFIIQLPVPKQQKG